MGNYSHIQGEITRLKIERNALILAHYYQRPEIQDIADFVGDSFGLSQKAARTDAEVIVFCGVHFMAESAYILAPDKTVLLPEPEAGCPMADMADVEELRQLKARYPDAAVVSYVNTSAAVKAESDICCTSANVLSVVRSRPEDKIIYTPDRNMGKFIADQTEKEIIPWSGYCYTHDRLRAEDIEVARRQNPDAVVMVHPECSPEVVAVADYATGTSGMLKLAREHKALTFIVGTEMGLKHALKKEAPEKKFVFPSKHLLCANMKLNTLEKVLVSLQTLEPQITVPEPILQGARSALDKMLQVT
ncbi:MAG: quinolinate synthase NadA [Firmicutes bacterium]|nr:quinolinate synthase NadA [Bacillota bacterium]